MRVLEEFYNFLERNNIDLYQETVVCGVSCGVDSIVLLDVLESASEKIGFKIVVGHVNHKKRAQSEIEEEFIRAYCKGKHDIEVLALVDENEVGEANFQKKARDKRLDFFKDVVNKYNGKYLFLAHHLNDDMETTFLRISRKASLKSISGIKELNIFDSMTILRPFMRLLKDEIYEYAREHSLKYFEDSSNSEDDYARNRYRHHVIPEFFRENENFGDAYLMFKERLQYASDLVDQKRDEFISKYISFKNNSFEFLVDYFDKIDMFMRKEVLFELLKNHQLGYTNIDEIIKLIYSKKANLIVNYKNICIIKEYNKIIISNDLYNKCEVDIRIDKLGRYKLNDIYDLEISLLDEEDKKTKNIVGNIDLIWYNIDKLPFFVRNRRDGDKIKLSSGSKKVKDLLIDNRVSLKDRDNALILLDKDEEIISVLGIKKSFVLKDCGDNNIKIKLIRRED